MNTEKPLLGKYWFNLLTAFAVPAFFVGFCVAYDPLGIKSFLSVGRTGFQFHILILYFILLTTLFITRTIIWLVSRRVNLSWWQHMLCCFGEVYVASFFLALYITLIKHGSVAYFAAFGISIGYLFVTLPYIYTILILIHIADHYNLLLKTGAGSDTNKKMARFYDEHGKLKLTVDTASVIYAKAEFNYVSVYYMDGTGLKNLVLRNSMKALERSSDTLGLIRCHRSYFVNPRHVQSLSRDRDGQIIATTDSPDSFSVPVSKNYYDSLSSIL